MARGRPWPKGQSGNPAGKIRGTRNKFTEGFERLSNEHGEQISKALYHYAIKGNMQAMKMVVEREMPPPRDRHIQFDMPDIETAADLPRATAALLRGVTEGLITPSEAADLSKLVDAHMNALRDVDIAARLAEIEGHLSISNGGREEA